MWPELCVWSEWKIAFHLTWPHGRIARAHHTLSANSKKPSIQFLNLRRQWNFQTSKKHKDSTKNSSLASDLLWLCQLFFRLKCWFFLCWSRDELRPNRVEKKSQTHERATQVKDLFFLYLIALARSQHFFEVFVCALLIRWRNVLVLTTHNAPVISWR